MNWYLKVLKNYAVFSGRARRKEYWMFALFQLIFALAAILPISTKKLISTANVSTFLSPFARPIFKLAHHSPGAILVGM